MIEPIKARWFEKNRALIRTFVALPSGMWGTSSTIFITFDVLEAQLYQ